MKVTIKTFFIFSLFVMLLIAGCSGSKSTTVVQQIVQGSSPVIQSLSVQGQPSVQGGKITATVIASSEQGLGLTYTWTAYNGWSVMSGGSTPTATIQAPDTYGVSGTATVEVSDTNGRYALNTFPLNTVGDSAPVINSFNVSPNPVPKGGVTSLYVSATSPDGNRLYYTWQAAEGWTIASGQGTSGITVTSPAQYGVSGTFTVTVYDSYGGTVSLSIPVSTVENSIPVISGMTASPNPAEKGGMMAIDVTATDPDGDSLSYVWQASQGWTIATGQGTSGITVTAPAQYGVSGTVTVTVDDGYGGTASLSVPVGTVGDIAPVINSFNVSPNPVPKGGVTSMDVTATSSDGNSLYYTWQAAEGWTIASGQGTSGITVTSPDQYGVSGTFTVTVYDAYSGTITMEIPVSTSVKSFPVITGFSVSPQTNVTSTTMSCSAYSPDGDALTYLWVLGGFTSTDPTTVWNSPGIPGHYRVSLLVVDDPDGSIPNMDYYVHNIGSSLGITFTDSGDVAVLVSSTSISITSTSEWPKFQRDLQSSGQSPVDTSLTTNGTKWTSPTGSPVWGPPAIGADGTIYFGSWNGNLYALNPTNGSVKWTYTTTGAAMDSSPAIGADGTIYIGSADGYLYALYPNGGLKWSSPTGSQDSSPSIGADGTIYIDDDADLYALNPTDGSVKWSYLTGALTEIDPAIGANGTIYVPAYVSGNNELYAIYPDGSLKWSDTTGNIGSIMGNPSIGADGTIYAEGAGGLDALNPTDGSVKWSYPVALGQQPAIGADGTIYVESQNGNLYALNPTNGGLKWKYPTGVWIESTPVIGADGTIYVTSEAGNLYAINPNGTLKWPYTVAGQISTGDSSPVIGPDGTIYFGSSDGALYAIH